MKNKYDGNYINCGMMLAVDYMKQCPDNDESNNLAVFPVVVSVDNTTGNSKFVFTILCPDILSNEK